MAITNGGFETQKTGGGPGEAEGWTTSITSTAEEYAEFTASVADLISTAQETFEGEWPAGFTAGVIVFSAYYDDIYPAFFDDAPEPHEDFEEGWPITPMGPFGFPPLPLEFAEFDEEEMG
jgi:hypothetical protein